MTESNIKLNIDFSNNLDENTNEKVPKKRGRKPKVKTLEEQEKEKLNVPKKRGRKPKSGIIKDVKIPKKRGRKPNIFNTKTTIIPVNTDKIIKNDNILHLKVNTKDLDECLMGNDFYKYDPNLNEPEPYENLDNLSSNNFLTIKNKETNNNLIQIKIDKNEHKEINENENNNYLNNEDFTEYNTQDSNYETNKKRKSIRPVMYYYNESNKRKKWPNKSNLKCLWCCHNFDNYPCALPIKLKMNTFYVFGNFCSKECACAYNFDSDTNNSLIWERYVLLNHLYSIIEDDPNLKIQQAPPRLSLIDFGGYLTIKEFRNSNTNTKYNVLFPPMVSIIPSIEENRKDKLKTKESYYIPIDKERIVKVNNDLRLKRKNPITNKNTLENCMMLKYN